VATGVAREYAAEVCEFGGVRYAPSRPLSPSLLLCVLVLAACSSQDRLTSRATPCNTKEVKVLNSEFSRRGVTTAWCAECKGKIYQCVTDIEHTKVECRPSTPDDICR
jgi:hypothetical protein